LGDALDLNVHLMTTLQTSKGVKAFQIYRRGQCLSAVFLPLVLPSRETINRQCIPRARPRTRFALQASSISRED